MIFSQVVPPFPQINSWLQLIGYLAFLGVLAYNTYESRRARIIGSDNKVIINDVKEHRTKTAQLVQEAIAHQGDVLGEIKEITNGRLDTALAKINSLETRIGDLQRIIAERKV